MRLLRARCRPFRPTASRRAPFGKPRRKQVALDVKTEGLAKTLCIRFRPRLTGTAQPRLLRAGNHPCRFPVSRRARFGKPMAFSRGPRRPLLLRAFFRRSVFGGFLFLIVNREKPRSAHFVGLGNRPGSQRPPSARKAARQAPGIAPERTTDDRGAGNRQNKSTDPSVYLLYPRPTQPPAS